MLSIPRKSKNNPGTHILVGKNGDVLRGRLLSFSSSEIVIEGRRGKPRTFPTERIAAVVWVAMDGDEPGPNTPGPTPDPEGFVTLVLDEDTRVAGRLLRLDDHEVTLESAILGEVTLELGDVLALISGPSQEPKPTLFDSWTLTPMEEPFPAGEAGANADGPAGRPAGVGIEVGSEAPEIAGTDIDGVDFQLSDYRGKVVLLDFWGHW